MLPGVRGLAASLLALAMIQSGCAETKPPDSVSAPEEKVAMDQVPAQILETAEKLKPGVDFRWATKGWEDGVLIYKLQGDSAEGEIHEVDVTATGEVVKQPSQIDGPDAQAPPESPE